MVHCCKESFFELFWAQQLQKIIRYLLHDLSNCLTGNLALSELYCTKEREISSEKIIIIRDNCYKEREILKQLSQLHHTSPGNVNYIDLQAFIEDLKPLVARLLPAHTKFVFDDEISSEILIKFDVAFLQRIFLLTTLLEAEIFENTSKPKLSIMASREGDRVSCQIESNAILDLKTEDLTEITIDEVSLSRFFSTIVHFYMEKHHGGFSYNTTPDGKSIINLTFPIVE